MCGLFTVHECTVDQDTIHCGLTIHAHCGPRHNSLWTGIIVLLHILHCRAGTVACECFHCGVHCLSFLFAKSIMGWRSVMTELLLPQRVAKIAGDGVVFLDEKKMVSWDFGGAARPWKQTPGTCLQAKMPGPANCAAGEGGLLCCVLNQQLWLRALHSLLRAIRSSLTDGPNVVGPTHFQREPVESQMRGWEEGVLCYVFSQQLRLGALHPLPRAIRSSLAAGPNIIG